MSYLLYMLESFPQTRRAACWELIHVPIFCVRYYTVRVVTNAALLDVERVPSALQATVNLMDHKQLTLLSKRGKYERCRKN